MIRNILLSVTFFLTALFTEAQEVQMADSFRSEGKIYVVIGVILLILAGLFFYLFTLDRKVKKMEKE